MPWSIFNRPSIQLACLKSYLEEKAEIMVDGFHPYLAIAKNIGTESYIRISGSPWAGEALFAALLFPEKLADAEKLYRDCFRGQQMPPPPFQQLLEILEQSCNQWLESIDLDRYGLSEIKGTIELEADDEPLSGPLSERDCVYYHYWEKERVGSLLELMWYSSSRSCSGSQAV